MLNQPKIIFIGTGDFAAPILESLAKSRLKIGFVITAPDKPAGRKRIITPPPVKKIALKYKISVLQPERITDSKLRIANYEPHLIIIADYGQIIPMKVIGIPKFGTVNVHPSLLPKYRGPTPIQTAILRGDKKTGITIMLIDEKVDHGPIIAQSEASISAVETGRTLEKKLAKKAGPFLIKTISDYLQGKIKPKKQKESKASYTKMLSRQDGKISWRETALNIERKIRAFDPWPGTWTILAKKRVKIIKARIIKKPTADNKDLIIKTKKGYLKLEIVQPEGKKPMTGQDFLRGRRLSDNLA